MTPPRILIVGGSIAGTTAAYWFARTGAKITVIERFPQFRTGGQAVDIRTVGVTVMRKMPGLEEAVRAKVAPVEGFNFVGERGQCFATIKPTGRADQQALISDYEIYRGDLAEILYDKTRTLENVEYVFGEQVASIAQEGGHESLVAVEFMNGRLPSAEYDLVVACDGATSRTRALGFGIEAQEYVHPTNCWAAYFNMSQDLIDGSKSANAYSAVGGRFMGIAPDSVSGNRVGLMKFYPSSQQGATLPFRKAMDQGEEELKQFISKDFRDAGWLSNEIMEAMMSADEFYAHEMIQIKSPRLHTGRFVVLGDAGYAPGPTGCGTSLAMAGAYVLAGEVGKSGGDIAAALRGYEDTMKPLIKEMQKIPPLVPALLAPQTSIGLWLRNTVLAIVSWTRIIEFAQKFLAPGLARTDKYQLPDYEF